MNVFKHILIIIIFLTGCDNSKNVRVKDNLKSIKINDTMHWTGPFYYDQDSIVKIKTNDTDIYNEITVIRKFFRNGDWELLNSKNIIFATILYKKDSIIGIEKNNDINLKDFEYNFVNIDTILKAKKPM